MTALINLDERYNRNRFASLANHPMLDEIENENMDDGRFFIHLKKGYKFKQNPYGAEYLKSVGSIKEARQWLNNVEKE